MREKTIKRSCSIMLGCALIVAPLYAQEPEKNAVQAPTARAGDTTANAVGEPEYKIGPQDVLKVDVWKEPDITRAISLPLLNDVQAAGLTTMELAASIREGLKKFINNPQVTVTLTEINSRRVYCTGEVSKPGALSLLPNMTALQALASCGGFTQFARIGGIYILRMENGKQVQHPFNYKDVVKGKKPQDNILLMAGDVIIVP